MFDNRKHAISIRLGDSDVRNVKRLAKRLGVRDSDVIRFALRSMLNRNGPLCDESICGRNLVPVLVESGDELIRYFELDAFRLDNIINAKVTEDERVHRDDIALLTMSSLREQYLVIRMQDGNGSLVDGAANGQSLRRYLYEKYVYRYESPKPANSATPAAEADRIIGSQRPAA